MRRLSEPFLHDLKDNDGILNPMLKRVHQDDALMLAIRDDSINLYYRGGNLLRVRRLGSDRYDSFVDVRYAGAAEAPHLPSALIQSAADVEAWLQAFSRIKDTMDRYLAGKGKAEREFQQLIVRENNYSSVSNATEYFVSDIEYMDPSGHERTDMLAVRWQASKRKSGTACRVALIEVKYGDSALDGKSGLLDHLQAMDALVGDRGRYQLLQETIETQFAQLDALGLLKYHRAEPPVTVQLDSRDRPEVILILANHNPRSRRLMAVLETPEVAAYAESRLYDLRFFVSSYCGYGLHCANMLDLDAFRARVRG